MKSSCAPAASSVCYLDFLLKSSIILNNPKQIPLFKLPPTDLYSLILGSSWQFPVSIHFKTDLQNYPKTIHRVIPQSFREHECRGKWARCFTGLYGLAPEYIIVLFLSELIMELQGTSTQMD